MLPTLAPVFGIDLSVEMIRQLGDNVVRLGQAAGGLIGTILTIYGRVRADQRLERRPVQLSL